MSKPKPTFPTELVPVDSIEPHPFNPRQISELSFDKLVKSLRECPDLFIARPILVSEHADGKRIIIGGDKRLWLALKGVTRFLKPCGNPNLFGKPS